MSAKRYLDFENRFRGDREKIIEQFSKYDKLLDLVLKDVKSPSILDIGCGRGEWLQKFDNNIYDCYGIENNPEMIRKCKNHGLNIIEGDAIKSLSNFNDNSINLISIFHLIEHLNHSDLYTLLQECHRVIKEDGLLLMETPSIDNLLVSSNTFYLDHTHITHINAQAINFTLEIIGFNSVKNYFINGGPLQDDSHMKLTRILNGTAQDLLIIATRSESIAQKLNDSSDLYEPYLNLGKTTLEAAVDFDLRLESQISQFIKYKDEAEVILDKQRQEIVLLKSELKLVIKFVKLLKFYLRPILNIFRFIKKIILYVANKLFNSLARFRFIRYFLTKSLVLKIINKILKILAKESPLITAKHINKKFDSNVNLSSEMIDFNSSLRQYYNNFDQPKIIEKRIFENFNKKKIK